MALQDLSEVTLARLGQALQARELTSREAVEWYVRRIDEIDRTGPELRSVIALNPDVLDIAAERDAERAAGTTRGPLHGIPILLKDNIDTGDGMPTTAGSLALTEAPASADATVARRLREAGAILLGKANLSEWANIRSPHSSSGWSAVGGQCRNPYVLDRTPCGSSSGSAVAVAANLAAAALGTETDGSVVCPSAVCGLVGIKPTVGLTSRRGVVPISASQDTVGTHGRTVADAALLLGAIAGPDPEDSATAQAPRGIDYVASCAHDGLLGARIGVPRKGLFGNSRHADAVIEDAIRALRAAGAEVVDPADIPSLDALEQDEIDELNVMLYELKAGLAEYLARRPGLSCRTLEDVIEFNRAHAAEELRWFGQEHFEAANGKGGLDDPEYVGARERTRRRGREEGLDSVLDRWELDALVAPTLSPPWLIDLVNGDHVCGGSSTVAAVAGYPLVTVPAGYALSELPIGLTFMGRAFSEPTLIRLAHGFEQVAPHRRPPRLLPTLPLS